MSLRLLVENSLDKEQYACACQRSTGGLIYEIKSPEFWALLGTSGLTVPCWNNFERLDWALDSGAVLSQPSLSHSYVRNTLCELALKQDNRTGGMIA